ncbi:MAG TPA: pilus assembly protein TadG-related protein [Croceibacterium sp.]|nr:pilus assembly protein TadG-related protein [Croceibacterium sp.]
MLLVALGMPVLIGGTGFAVDTAQWYMWKGELQYAVDQAAIAGAWARTKDETEASYATRAQQEYAANLAQTDAIASAAAVSLQNYATGTQNSVVVSASATRKLPFSFFLTGQTTTVRVRAQAAFEEGTTFTSCLVAVDEHASGAVTIGGSAEFIAGCGIMAMSDSATAITVNGNPTIEAGWLLAAGQIDDWFDDPNNSDDTILENQDNLVDPFAELDPPAPAASQVEREYACPDGEEAEDSYIADSVTTRTQITYRYFTKSGNNYNSTSYNGPAKKANVDTTETATNVTLAELPADPNGTYVTGPTDSGYVQVDGSGNSKIFEKSTTTLTKTYVNAHLVTAEGSGDTAVLLPGTYPDLTMACDTVFTSGVYILDGGSFVVHAQHDVTGAGVMFVLKNGAGIVINGGASVNLTAMTVSELEAAGIGHDDAVLLDGMLIFEDPDSEGNAHNKINGNASTILNGAVYLPVSNLDLRGSAGVTSQCLLLVASTISLSGNVSMESFCPAGMTEDDEVATTQSRVRLVS